MPAVDKAWSERIEGRGAHAPTPAPKAKKAVAKKKPVAKKKG